ncbi:nephrocystin-3 isoform X1 [Iris pallida]|uniref:Nephrocystin-3 isoform X1 n=1 Tax=Iris pallida TaxID=29817 RepID=A0AAX6HEG3_IRIPA|nr:nephrocystin-3 isoform X1 [Iris pallida]
MEISLLHLLPFSFHSGFRKEPVFISTGGLKCVRCRLKLRFASKRSCLSSTTVGTEKLESRPTMHDKSNMIMDSDDDFEKNLQDFFVEVKNMLEMGNKNDAIDLLQANYEMVKEQVESGLEGIEQAALLDVIALGYMGAGEVKLVESLLDMLDEIMADLHYGNPLMDPILMHMGSMYATLGKFKDAIRVYGRGLEILERQFGNYSPFLITPLMGMAKGYTSLGKATKALTFYHRAVDILEKNRGVDSEELVVPLFSLSNVLIKEGKAAEAEACFSRILDIYTKAYGENNGRVGMAMCSMAHALCVEGRVEEAISIYRRGLKVIKESEYMTLDDEVLEKMRMDLAELLHVTGREHEGRELLQESLLITERHKGFDHPSTAVHLVNLAASYSRSKNYVEAERLLKTSLHIMSKSVGPKDQSITLPMLHLAVILYNLNRDEEAESLAQEVVSIRENAFGKESLPVGEALDCLVSIQARLGKDDGDILAKLKRILRIQEREFGYESEDTVITLKKVVFYLDKMGKKDEKMPLDRRLRLLRTKYKERFPV